MRAIAGVLVCLTLVATPVQAQSASDEAGAVRFVSAAVREAEARALAAFGPFRVLDEETAALVDVTDEQSPADFQALLRAYPRLATLRFLEAPGTLDDRANLRLGRMIRAAGLATEVPAEGSVRSGAVELVLAGVTRRIDDRAEFAVHAWCDESGRQATDYPAGSQENAKYLAYYRDMGIDAATAAAFYAMTNATPFEQARWLTGAELRGWLGDRALPTLAYLDLGALLN